MMKHKHYDLIVAWANGAKVEVRGYFNNDYRWHDCTENPHWSTHQEYRIKKEPVITVKYFQQTGMHDIEYFEFEPDLEKWDLRITYSDGIAIKAELPTRT